MNTDRVLTIFPDDKQKTALRKSILQKRQALKDFATKIEMLKMELDLIKHEYNVRIGGLLLKDNQLDLELIQLRNLKRLMDEGMTYEEALKHEEDTFYNEILRMQKEQEKLDEEKEILETIAEFSSETAEVLKSLWKKLIREFHPDLVQDKKEKHKREDIMKQINAAYVAGDIDTLTQIFITAKKIPLKHATKEDLETELLDVENALLSAQNQWEELQISEWFIWKKKIDIAKKTHEDVFAQLEKNLLDDITKKITIARELRLQVHPEVIV